MSIGEGVLGADLNVTPTGMEDLATKIAGAQAEFAAAKEAIDQEIQRIAEQAMGEDSTDFQAFRQKYEQEMKPLAEEIDETLANHAKNAQITADAANETIQKNINVIG